MAGRARVERRRLTGSNVRLTSGSSARLVSIRSLAEAAPASMDEDDTEADFGDRWEVPAVLLASLTARQHQQLLERLQVLRHISEPDPEDRRTLIERYDEAAAATGVARRTLQRQMARLAASGPAGLVDARKTRDARRSVDAEVLTDDLDDVFTRYYAEHPDADGLEVFDE